MCQRSTPQAAPPTVSHGDLTASQEVTALIDGVFIEHPVCLVTAAAAVRTLLSATIACKALLTTAARMCLPAALCTLCQQRRLVVALAAPGEVNS